jgi:hypothetical protein
MDTREGKEEMNNKLAVRQSFTEIMTMGDVFYKSGLFKDLQSAAQAVIKIQAGAELGLPAFASMSGINFISGKAVLGANLIATLVKNDPRYDYKVIKSDNSICEIAFYENGKECGRTSYTWEEATKAGLTNKDVWQKYPSDLLFARAISRGTRRFTPGVFGGAPIYTPEELGADTDEDGNVIAGQFKDVEVTNPIPVEHDAPMPEQETKVKNGANPSSPVQALVDAGIAENVHESAKIVNMSPFPKGKMTLDELVAWGRLYRGWRDSGQEPKAAVEKATAGEKP